MHLELKYHEISFGHNLLLSCQIILKFCTEHGSITAVLCANFQNDLATEIGILGVQVSAKFEFKMSSWMNIPYYNGPHEAQLWAGDCFTNNYSVITSNLL